MAEKKHHSPPIVTKEHLLQCLYGVDAPGDDDDDDDDRISNLLVR